MSDVQSNSRLLATDGETTVKAYVHGTDRTMSPADTLARVVPAMGRMGITRLANITGLDVIGVPVVMACRPNARSLSVTQGKGIDLHAAKASALMEAVESYHGEHITLPLTLGSYNDLSNSLPLVDVDRLPAEGGFFDRGQPQLWIEGHCLLSGTSRWLPFDMVHSDFTYASRMGRGIFDITTNGLASGNHPLEAISHGICEIVERDATAIWYQLPPEARARSRLALETVDDPGCCGVLERLTTAGISVGVWDITTDIGLPAFFCAIGEERLSSWQPLYGAHGMGCHPKREIALLRAMTEAVQSRLTGIAGSRDDIFRFDYERMRDPRAHRRTQDMLHADEPTRDFAEVPTHINGSFDEDVTLELERLRSVGVSEVVTVELSKPEFGIPVVRTVVPGLEFYVKTSLYRPGARAKAVVEAMS